MEGVGGRKFLPASRPKPRRPAFWARKPKQKNFLFLLEEKNRRGQNKKCRENFSARHATVIGGWWGGIRAHDLVSSRHALRAWHIVSDFGNRCELGKIETPE